MNMEVFDETPLEGVENEFEAWEPAPEFAPPPPAGKYRAYVAQVRESKPVETAKGQRVGAVIDFRISGGPYDERAVTWQRISNVEMRNRKSSMMLDLIKSAKVQQAPRSNGDFNRMIWALAERGPQMLFGMQFDWRGFCTSCYERELMKATGAADPKSAKEQATSEQKSDASKVATKAKNYRGFPPGPNGGPRLDHFKCATCGETVQAQVRINRFFPAEEV